jgi:hypothetical protein
MRTIAEKQPTYATCSTAERRRSHWAEEVASNDDVWLDFQGYVGKRKRESDLPVPHAKRNGQSDTNLSLLDASDDENNFSSNTHVGSLATRTVLPGSHDMNMLGVSDHEMAIENALISLLTADANTVSSDYLRQMILQMQITSRKLRGHISSPEDCNNDDFHSNPEEMQRESSKSKKRRGGEMSRIADHLGAGLHDHAAAPDVALLSSTNNCNRQRIAK